MGQPYGPIPAYNSPGVAHGCAVRRAPCYAAAYPLAHVPDSIWFTPRRPITAGIETTESNRTGLDWTGTSSGHGPREDSFRAESSTMLRSAPIYGGIPSIAAGGAVDRTARAVPRGRHAICQAGKAGKVNALPKLEDLDAPLTPVPGDIPSPLERPDGCVFHTRCDRAEPRCSEAVPQQMQYVENHVGACFVTAEQRGAT